MLFREFSKGRRANAGPWHRRHRPQFAQDPGQEHSLVNLSVIGFTRQRVLLIAPRRELLVGACSQTRKGVPWNTGLPAERLRWVFDQLVKEIRRKTMALSQVNCETFDLLPTPTNVKLLFDREGIRDFKRKSVDCGDAAIHECAVEIGDTG
jgi:hypothetical protein